jgi:hypothetical protein
VAQAHTHPTRCRTMRSGPRPSAQDQSVGDQLHVPVFTVSPDGIWRYDPNSKDITRIAPNNWYREPQDRNCKPCEGIPQP